MQVHNALSVKESSVDDPSSGLGLFVDRTKIDREEMDGMKDIELLRIAKTATISTYRINSILKDSSQYSCKQACQRTQERMKKAIRDFLSLKFLTAITTESVVLVVELLILHSLKGEYEIPRTLDYYIETVLLETKVNSILLCDQKSLSIYEHLFPCKLFGSIFEVVDSFLAKYIPEKSCSLMTIQQMFAAVQSRTLEIPKQVSADSEDFTVETTLVPVLDFANHDNSLQNAHFDVDRETQDVLLLLELPKCDRLSDNEEFEVFISYSPAEDLMHFCGTYGFAPQTNNATQYFNMSLHRSYLKNHAHLNVNLRLFYKWLAINPVIQLIKHEEKWYINDTGDEFASLLLPFISLGHGLGKSCWEYDSHSYRTFAFFRMSQDEHSHDHQALLNIYAKKVIQMENDNQDYIDLPQLAWTMRFKNDDGALLHGRLTAQEALEVAPFHEPEIFGDAISSFSNYFITYLEWRLNVLREARNEHGTESPILHVLENEISIAESIIKDKIPLFWTDLEPEAQAMPFSYPLPALHITHELSPLTKETPMIPDFASLALNDFDPSKQTDFLVEELEKYKSFVY